MRWMELESVMQSEVSQKEKNKYSMLTHLYWSIIAWQDRNKDADVENGLEDMGRGKDKLG